MTTKCSTCEHQHWRYEDRDQRSGPYCAANCESLRPDEDYKDCPRYLALGQAKEWKPRN